MNFIDRTDTSLVGKWWWTVDRVLLASILALAIFGTFLVAAASPAVAERIGLSSFHFVNKHLFYLVLSLGGMIFLSMLPQKAVRRLALIGLLASCLGIVLTLISGEAVKGAQRWINFAGLSLQPSEFMKPCFAMTAAWLLARQIEGHAAKNFHILAGFYAVVVGLLLLQPDFGMTMLTTLMLSAQIFMAGIPLLLVFVLGVGALGLAIVAYLTLPHVASRMNRFFDPASGDTYQIEKSIESFSGGGLFGVGPGEGTVKMLLPDAHADFVFAVSGEEMGFIWTLLLIGLFLFIIIRSMLRTMQSDDLFSILAVSGLISLFAMQAMIHMGSSLHMIPTKGMTLPFVSYGGSSLLSMGMTMGFILSLTRKRPGFSGIKSIRPVQEKSRGKSIQIAGKVS